MLKLLFGVHNHQPVGNFEHIFQKANHQAYRPFIDVLYKYPQIKATLHFSGSLIDWLLKNDPDLLKRVKEMIGRNQVEILGGGYYEPILPIIPKKDRIGQINMLSSFISEYFECDVRGMWLGERVWDPSLTGALVRENIQYVLLDDFHFRYAGVDDQHLCGYYFAEDRGQKVAVFPISKKLRYALPFSHPNQALASLKSLAGAGEERAAIIIDDGEKFGLWPGTHKWVYGEKWLERFFQIVIKNKDWLTPQTVSEYMREHKPLGTKYFPPASYEEMMRWSNGAFNSFFTKYPEANNLHKRMLYVSEKLEKAENKNQEAKMHLYKAQCNCPYWHGVFGGVYLGHLRQNAYKNLITAEVLLEKQEPLAEIETYDFDQDGIEEIIIKNLALNVFVTPAQGGGIFELDYKPKSFNLMNTMTRRPEAYHEKIKTTSRGSIFNIAKREITSIHDLLHSKEKGLENSLIYDSYRRISCLEHFFEQNVDLEAIKRLDYQELGDFISGAYRVTKQSKTKQNASVSLEKEGQVSCEGENIPVKIEKTLSLNAQEAKVIIDYRLENLGSRPVDAIFGVEFNLSPEGKDAPNRLYCKRQDEELFYDLSDDVSSYSLDQIHLQDGVAGIESIFTFDQKASLYSYPLETVSASAEGFERNWQQTLILPYWPLKLKKLWQLKIVLQFRPYLVIINEQT